MNKLKRVFLIIVTLLVLTSPANAIPTTQNNQPLEVRKMATFIQALYQGHLGYAQGIGLEICSCKKLEILLPNGYKTFDELYIGRAVKFYKWEIHNGRIFLYAYLFRKDTKTEAQFVFSKINELGVMQIQIDETQINEQTF